MSVSGLEVFVAMLITFHNGPRHVVCHFCSYKISTEVNIWQHLEENHTK